MRSFCQRYNLPGVHPKVTLNAAINALTLA